MKSFQRSQRNNQRPAITVVAAIVLLTAGTLIAGCGGSSGGSNSTSATRLTGQVATAGASGSGLGGSAGSSSTRSEAAGGNGQASTETAKLHDKILHGKVVQGPAPGTGAGTINDDNSSQVASRADTGKHKSGSSLAAGEIDPCSLVTRSQAESIVGRELDVPRIAPLGPTCIYQSRGSKNSITLAVEIADFSKIQPHIRKVSKLNVRGHVGYCGDYGQAMTFVPLPDKTVLNVTAPCAVGRLMAVAALTHLAA